MENKGLIKKIAALGITAAAAGTILAACGGSEGSSGTSETTSSTTTAAATTAAASTTTAAATSSSDVPEVVNIGVQTLITPELAVRYENLYEDYLGTKVNLVQFDSGASVNQAFTAKSIDIAAMGTSPASIGVANDLGYEVFWYHDVIGSAESLAATSGSGASTLEDLKGKKIGTPFASTAHYSLLNALSLEGIDPAEVELLDLQPDDIYAAWNRGDIDAAYVWNPVLGELKKDNATIITDSAELAQKGIVTADVSVISKEFAEKYPEVATNYIKAQIYGVDKFNSDRDEIIKEIAAQADITEEDAASQVEDFIYPTGEEQITQEYLGTKDKKGDLAKILKATADFLVTQGSIDSAPDLSVFEDGITGEFIENALK